MNVAGSGRVKAWPTQEGNETQPGQTIKASDPSDPLGVNSPGKFEQLGAEVGKLTDEKQWAYGDSYGKAGQVMEILYPDGILPCQYDDALAVVRVVDKLFRIATKKDAFGESPWKDIAGYGLLGAAKCQK